MNKKFFENLAIEAGTNDIEIIKRIYYSLIRKTIKDLASGRNLIYPDFGEFYVKERKARNVRNVADGNMIKTSPVNIVKFKPCNKLKNYVKIKDRY